MIRLAEVLVDNWLIISEWRLIMAIAQAFQTVQRWSQAPRLTHIFGFSRKSTVTSEREKDQKKN